MKHERARSKRIKPMKDRDVRNAVLQKVIAEHVNDSKTLVVEELGLEHGACRVDIAVINGALHGYELKSQADTLERLPSQVESYSKVLDRATLVTAEEHLDEAISHIPNWWGIKVATVGVRGAILIDTFRPVSNNPTPSAFHIAQLLWRPEALAILESLDLEKKALRTNRAGLYTLLAQSLGIGDLRKAVREQLKHRRNWRDRAPPA